MTKYRKMLPNWEAPYLQPLIELIETQSKPTLANWCIDYAEEHLLPIYLKDFPDDPRPANAIDGARKWLAGEAKLPEIKPIILECHAAAREADGHPAAQAAARAIGQCASSIHSASHSAGLALYGSLAITYDILGPDATWEDLELVVAEECSRMEVALKAVAVKDEPNPAKMTWSC